MYVSYVIVKTAAPTSLEKTDLGVESVPPTVKK